MNGDFTLDTKRQFDDLRRKFQEEARNKKREPLQGKDFDDAADLLLKHFGGK